MANQGDEFIPKPLPEESSPDYFKVLMDNCIIAFRITYSDSTALDANGVVGKLRPMILDDPYYKSETKKIRAQKIIDDLSELNNIQRTVTYEEDDEEEEEEKVREYDIRNPASSEEPKVKKPKKLFDKSQIDLQMKIFQAKRDLLAENKGEEEKEGDAINYFFVPVSREEFERMKTIEVSEGSGDGADAYAKDESDAIQAVTGKDAETQGLGEFADLGGEAHYEEIDGEKVLMVGK
jgi:hypothetical protein